MKTTSLLVALAFALPCAADDDIASPAVEAYLKSAASFGPKATNEIKEAIKRLQTRPQGKRTKAESLSNRKRLEKLRAIAKEIESGNYFIRPESLPAEVRAGFAGRITLNYSRDTGERPSAFATIAQVIDGQSAIVEIGQRTFWMTGFSTEGLEDGARVQATGVFYCPGSKRYENVLGGTKTVLVLEAFSEKDVLPHLSDKHSESLKRQIEE